MNNFDDDLQYSQKGSCEVFWDAVYRKAFPNLVSHMPANGDFPSQRMGIDRVILLANGKTVYIDEKKRRKDRGDILLEYLSNDRTSAPGWIEKDLAIDFMAYAFMPSERVYLYPWPSLRRAWVQHNQWWKKQCPIIKAENPGYFTWSVAVPTDILNCRVRDACVIEVPGTFNQL